MRTHRRQHNALTSSYFPCLLWLFIITLKCSFLIFLFSFSQKVPKASENAQSEDGGLDVKDSSDATKLLSKKGAKKPALSENEVNVLKKRMREMYDAVESYQVLPVTLRLKQGVIFNII